MFNFFLSFIAARRLAPKRFAASVYGRDEHNPNEEPPKPPKNPDQPPDLDELFNRLIGRDPNRPPAPNSGNDGPLLSGPSPRLLAVGVALGLLLWLALGFYTVQEREHGVETFLGKYQATTQAGLNWNWPAPLGRVEKVNVTSIATMRVGELKTQKGRASTKEQRTGQMLTSDENIVEIGATVQYRVQDAKRFLFTAHQPDKVLEDIVVSAIREVVGANTVDDILRDKRNEWPEQAKQIMVNILKQYDLGIEIVAFELQDARAPAEVQDAFEDAVRAREDEERARLQAEAYANQRLPSARGEAEQLRQGAQAYKAQVLAQAKADVSRFQNLLQAYRLNKEVMRERLYLDTMTAVYGNSQKVIVDAPDSRPIINLGASTGPALLPLLTAPQPSPTAPAPTPGVQPVPAPAAPAPAPAPDLRSRQR